MSYPMDTVCILVYDRLYADLLETKCYLRFPQIIVISTSVFLLGSTVCCMSDTECQFVLAFERISVSGRQCYATTSRTMPTPCSGAIRSCFQKRIKVDMLGSNCELTIMALMNIHISDGSENQGSEKIHCLSKALSIFH
jgi:hypothetical protein